MAGAEHIAAAALARLYEKPGFIMQAPGFAAQAVVLATEKVENPLATFFPAQAEKTAARGKRTKEEFKFPVEPRVIQVVKKPKIFMNHSYRDFSSVPPEADDEPFPEKLQDMSFPQKVYHILADEKNVQCISWMPHGRAFKVHVPALFEKNVSEKYFNHKRYSSFLRQLSNHGFKHVSHGKDRNCYYHEFVLRGLPHLLKYMPKPKDARRLIPDPDNEPDFYKITRKYPLPDDPEFGKEHEDMPDETLDDDSSRDETPDAQEESNQAKPARLASQMAGTSEFDRPAKRQASIPQAPPPVAIPAATSAVVSPSFSSSVHSPRIAVSSAIPQSLGVIDPFALPTPQTESGILTAALRARMNSQQQQQQNYNTNAMLLAALLGNRQNNILNGMPHY